MKEKGSRISTSLLVLHRTYAFAAVNMNVLLCILYLLYVFCSFVCMNYKYHRSYLSWRALQNMGKYIWRKIDAQTNRHSLRGQCQTDWSNMDESWMRSENWKAHNRIGGKWEMWQILDKVWQFLTCRVKHEQNRWQPNVFVKWNHLTAWSKAYDDDISSSS